MLSIVIVCVTYSRDANFPNWDRAHFWGTYIFGNISLLLNTTVKQIFLHFVRNLIVLTHPPYLATSAGYGTCRTSRVTTPLLSVLGIVWGQTQAPLKVATHR